LSLSVDGHNLAVIKQAESGVSVDHRTLNRWVVRYSPFIASEAKKRKQSVAGSWRIDETYIKVKGQ
jgi:putative transposase